MLTQFLYSEAAPAQRFNSINGKKKEVTVLKGLPYVCPRLAQQVNSPDKLNYRLFEAMLHFYGQAVNQDWHHCFRVADSTGDLGQTSFKLGLARGMISSDVCLKLYGWEIRDEGSDAA